MRLPLVLIPQYFGSLVFDRRSSRYAPFDHAATALLAASIDTPVDRLLDVGRASVPAAESIEAASAGTEARPTTTVPAAAGFVDAFRRAGYFRPDGRFAGVQLDVAPAADHLTGPLATHIEIVAACNLSCTHCFAGELPRKTTLSVAELDRVFADLAAIGAFRVGLTGGEPLLRKDLLQIIDAATAHGLHPCLTTNGLLLDEDLARELGKRELVWINVSLDGASAATNDRVRGDGTFDGVVAKLRAFGHLMRFTIAFTITKISAGETDRCAALAQELGAHTVVFRPVYPVGTARHHPELTPSFAEYSEAIDRVVGGCNADVRGIDTFAPKQRVDSQAVTYSGPGCGAANLVASISSSGDVNPCSFLGSSFESGNIRDRSFREIWNAGHAFRRLREQREGDTFRGGCRARALATHGDAFARDPWHDAWLGESSTGQHPLANVHVRLPVIR